MSATSCTLHTFHIRKKIFNSRDMISIYMLAEEDGGGPMGASLESLGENSKQGKCCLGLIRTSANQRMRIWTLKRPPNIAKVNLGRSLSRALYQHRPVASARFHIFLFVLSTTPNFQLTVLHSPNPDGILVRLRVHTTVCECANHFETVTQDQRLR